MFFGKTKTERFFFFRFKNVPPLIKKTATKKHKKMRKTGMFYGKTEDENGIFRGLLKLMDYEPLFMV